jgi:hypothetical protein
VCPLLRSKEFIDVIEELLVKKVSVKCVLHLFQNLLPKLIEKLVGLVLITNCPRASQQASDF